MTNLVEKINLEKVVEEEINLLISQNTLDFKRKLQSDIKSLLHNKTIYSDIDIDLNLNFNYTKNFSKIKINSIRDNDNFISSELKNTNINLVENKTQFYKSCISGDLETIQKIIKYNPNFLSEPYGTFYYKTQLDYALSTAIDRNHENIIQFLLSLNFNILSIDASIASICKKNRMDILTYLVKDKNLNLNIQSCNEVYLSLLDRALYESIKQDNLTIVTFILNNNTIDDISKCTSDMLSKYKLRHNLDNNKNLLKKIKYKFLNK